MFCSDPGSASCQWLSGWTWVDQKRPRGIGAFGVCRLGTSHVQVNMCAANAGRTEKNLSRNWIDARITNYADADGLRSRKQIEAQQQPSKDKCS